MTCQNTRPEHPDFRFRHSPLTQHLVITYSVVLGMRTSGWFQWRAAIKPHSTWSKLDQLEGSQFRVRGTRTRSFPTHLPNFRFRASIYRAQLTGLIPGFIWFCFVTCLFCRCAPSDDRALAWLLRLYPLTTFKTNSRLQACLSMEWMVAGDVQRPFDTCLLLPFVFLFLTFQWLVIQVLSPPAVIPKVGGLSPWWRPLSSVTCHVIRLFVPPVLHVLVWWLWVHFYSLFTIWLMKY